MKQPEAAAVRPDWRESLTHAGDLVVLGAALLAACLPVVTAGAAVAAASGAVHQLCEQRSLPAARDLLVAFRRRLAGGVAATAVALAVVAVLALDAALLGGAAIPGARPVAVALAIVAAGVVALGAVTTVRIGQSPESGWRAAVRWSARLLRARPWLGPAVLATLAVPALLAWAVPVLALLLPGLVLFALHAVVRRAA